MAKLDRMNTRFQRGAMEIKLDLIKGLSQPSSNLKNSPSSIMEIKLDLIKGLSPFWEMLDNEIELLMMEIKLDLIKGLSQLSTCKNGAVSSIYGN